MTAAMTEGERILKLEVESAEVRRDIHQIRQDVGTMRDRLAGRPSWAVTTIITVLASSCTGLIVALAQTV